LQEPADDERGETRRETNCGRAQAIESDPREEDPLLSEPVTQSTGDQGQGRERQQLGVHHPLQIERRQAHVSADRRERDRDDGAADEHEATAQARRGEHLCAALRADRLRFGERQAAVSQDQGRAAHDLIPQVRSSDSRRASRDIAGYSAWMRAETIAATQKATIIDATAELLVLLESSPTNIGNVTTLDDVTRTCRDWLLRRVKD
jgi:hypothetical protein